jgi:succinoglycan biosynthesis transport protein ExoP
MLQYQKSPSSRSADGVDDVDRVANSTISLQSILDFVSRRYREVGIAVGIGLLLGIIYLLTATPSYTASVSMIIDSNKVQLFQQQQAMFNDLPMDAGAVESQVEVLKSESIALAVIKQLHLTEDPEFAGGGGGIFGTLLEILTGSFWSSGPTSEFALTRQAVGAFESRLKVQRVGLTYVILISFRSTNAERAAQVANAVAEAYVNDQLEAKYQAAKRAGTWLQTRLHELREQASAAELAVVNYKNQNSMIDTGGRTINEQQLAELNSQLILARTQTAAARAKFDRVQEILTSNSPDAAVNATVTDTLTNDVISKLRSQYLEMSQHVEDWTIRYGATHLAVVNLRNQMREIQNAIHNELQRIAETYKSDLAIAQQKEENAQKQLSSTVADSQVTNQAQVALRELQSNAQTYQALYDNFLQRYMESIQQQSFPITDTRVISAATRPLGKSNPRTTLVLAASAFVGLFFGMGIAGWRELADRVFRTSNQVEDLLQTECIALVPALKEMGAEKPELGLEWIKKFVLETIAKAGLTSLRREPPARAANETLRRIALELDHRGKTSLLARDLAITKKPATGQQVIAAPGGVFSAITDSPLSVFAEAIRSIKMAVDLNINKSGAQIIGFTSSVPNEGKSSVASAVARLAAQTGAKTLLVDCDLRNPSLSRLLAPHAAAGVVEVLKEQSTLEEAIWVDRATGLAFLPVAVSNRRLIHSSEFLASEQTSQLFDSLRGSYDYIFVDFSPLMPIVDVRGSTKLVDSYIYVIEWGQTRIDFVESALRSARGVYDHLLGVVLNKVDLPSLGRYEGRSAYYHHGSYHRYGYTE